jgi:hypothetical protein
MAEPLKSKVGPRAIFHSKRSISRTIKPDHRNRSKSIEVIVGHFAQKENAGWHDIRASLDHTETRLCPFW